MRRGATTALCLCVLAILATPASAQMLERGDAIWARSTAGQEITLNGNLDEAAWDAAEAHVIRFGESAGLPGSGWFPEGGRGDEPTDTMLATVKFLVDGNMLYMGVVVQDSSVGGSRDFNRKDGFLMNIWDKMSANRPLPPVEYFYSWWYPNVGEGGATVTMPEDSVGISPNFIGRYGNIFSDHPFERTEAEIAAWDAVTVVNGGVSNSDEDPDEGYTVEMRFDVSLLGYDLSQADGEIVPFNISIYDADFMWPQSDKFSSNRTWWQNPWGNADALSKVRIHTHPDVTINSGDAPAMMPDAVIPNGANFDAPTIDGMMDEDVWAEIEGLEIRYGDEDLRDSYGGLGPLASGWFQPELNGAKAPVLDPGDVTVKWFFRGNMLYLGVDARDQVVVGTGAGMLDMWDGVRFTIEHRDSMNSDGSLKTFNFSAYIDSTGSLAYASDLFAWAEDEEKVNVAMMLKEGTTFNNSADADAGYQIEMAFNLDSLGYPEGRGDGVMFMGITQFDGDTFDDDPGANYGTRTWWYREAPGRPAPAFVYMDPNELVGTAAEGSGNVAGRLILRGTSPNPARARATLRYALPAAGDVTLHLYDLLGRRISTVKPGLQGAGEQAISIDATALASGVYVYRLEVKGAASSSAQGRLVIVK